MPEPTGYGNTVADEPVDFTDPELIAEIRQTVDDSRQTNNPVAPEELWNYVQEIAGQLDGDDPSDAVGLAVRELSAIYAGRMDEYDHSDAWTAFVPNELERWNTLFNAAAESREAKDYDQVVQALNERPDREPALVD